MQICKGLWHDSWKERLFPELCLLQIVMLENQGGKKKDLILFSIWNKREKSSLSTYLSVSAYKSTGHAGESISKSLQDRQKTLGFKLCSQYLWNFRWQCYCWNLKCGTGWLMAVVPGRRCPVESSGCWLQQEQLCRPGFICTIINNILLLQHSLLWKEIQILVDHSTGTDSSAQSQQIPGLQLQWLQLMSQIQLLKHFSAIIP